MPDYSPQKNKIGKAFVISGGVFLVLCAIGGIAIQNTDIGQAAGSYDKNLAAFKAAGLVTTGAEYEAKIAVPDADNAGLVLGPLFRGPETEFLEKNFPRGVSSVPGGPPVAATKGTSATITIKLTAKEKASLAPILAKIEPLLDRKYCVFKRDWSDPLNTPFPEYARLKSILKGLEPLASEALDAGDTETALKHYRMAARITSWIDDDGTLIALLVRVSSLSIVERSLCFALEKHGKDPKFVAGLPPILKEMSAPYSFDKIFLAEGLFGSAAIDSLGKPTMTNVMGEETNESRLISIASRIPVIKKAWASRLLGAYATARQMQPSSPTDYAGHRAALKTFEEVSQRRELSYRIANIAVPVMGAVSDAIERERSQLNVLKQATEAARIRNSTGAFPTKLPFGGEEQNDYVVLPAKPLQLDTSAGFRVWSLGTNKVNDGGVRDLAKKLDDYGIWLKK